MGVTTFLFIPPFLKIKNGGTLGIGDLKVSLSILL